MRAILKKGTPDCISFEEQYCVDGRWIVQRQFAILGECMYFIRSGAIFVEGFGRGIGRDGRVVERHFSEKVDEYIIEHENGEHTHISSDGSKYTEKVINDSSYERAYNPDTEVDELDGWAVGACVFLVGILSLSFLMML